MGKQIRYTIIAQVDVDPEDPSEISSIMEGINGYGTGEVVEVEMVTRGASFPKRELQPLPPTVRVSIHPEPQDTPRKRKQTTGKRR